MFVNLIITQMKTKCHDYLFDYSIQCYLPKKPSNKEKNRQRHIPEYQQQHPQTPKLGENFGANEVVGRGCNSKHESMISHQLGHTNADPPNRLQKCVSFFLPVCSHTAESVQPFGWAWEQELQVNQQREVHIPSKSKSTCKHASSICNLESESNPCKACLSLISS